MTPDMLHVVTCVSNPMLWKSRIALYNNFQQHMLDSGVKLTTIECAFGERPFEIEAHPDVNLIQVRSNTLIWNKENLLNLAIARLPEDWRYVAWIDADIHFKNKDWAVDTLNALQLYDVIQPWTHCYDLGPKGEHLTLHTSFCHIAHTKGIPPKDVNAKYGARPFPHPGYAWAATRTTIEGCGGLLETAYLGAGDHHMALAFLGLADRSFPPKINTIYKQLVMAWEARAVRSTLGNLGYIPGTIEHMWHGSKTKRQYVNRWDILISHEFNPITHVHKNSQGVAEFSCNNPKLRLAIDKYFRERDEDENTA